MSLSAESIAEAKHKLETLDKKDEERKKTAELKNNLEGYIYTTREKVCSYKRFWLDNCLGIYIFLRINLYGI